VGVRDYRLKVGRSVHGQKKDRRETRKGGEKDWYRPGVDETKAAEKGRTPGECRKGKSPAVERHPEAKWVIQR